MESGAGIILEFPEGKFFEYALKFEFWASNNAMVSKVMLAWLDLAKATKAKKIHVKSDSQLVVGQSTGNFEARKDSIKKY